MSADALTRALALLAATIVLGACGETQTPAHLRIDGGNAERGRQLVTGTYGCASCHTIDEIRHPRGVTGPPLTDFAQRALFAGKYPNVPRYLIPWLIDPPALAPQTGMPNVGVTERDARDIASYLYTLGAAGVAIYPSLPAFPAEREEPPVTNRPRDDVPAPSQGFVRVPIEQAMRHFVDSQKTAPAISGGDAPQSADNGEAPK